MIGTKKSVPKIAAIVLAKRHFDLWGEAYLDTDVETAAGHLPRSRCRARYFQKNPPARIFVCAPAWPGHFDIEIDCIAAV
jgi:enamine deaminase RidA (YjgF/YER057c/UK114 family)